MLAGNDRVLFFFFFEGGKKEQKYWGGGERKAGSLKQCEKPAGRLGNGIQESVSAWPVG